MVTVAIATGLTSYIPMMYADNLEQGLQVCRLLKEIEPKEVYTVVSSADLSLNLEHVKDYSWKEELVWSIKSNSITTMVKITCTATSTVRMSSLYNHLTLTASLYAL